MGGEYQEGCEYDCEIQILEEGNGRNSGWVVMEKMLVGNPLFIGLSSRRSK